MTSYQRPTLGIVPIVTFIAAVGFGCRGDATAPSGTIEARVTIDLSAITGATPESNAVTPLKMATLTVDDAKGPRLHADTITSATDTIRFRVLVWPGYVTFRGSLNGELGPIILCPETRVRVVGPTQIQIQCGGAPLLRVEPNTIRLGPEPPFTKAFKITNSSTTHGLDWWIDRVVARTSNRCDRPLECLEFNPRLATVDPPVRSPRNVAARASEQLDVTLTNNVSTTFEVFLQSADHNGELLGGVRLSVITHQAGADTTPPVISDLRPDPVAGPFVLDPDPGSVGRVCLDPDDCILTFRAVDPANGGVASGVDVRGCGAGGCTRITARMDSAPFGSADPSVRHHGTPANSTFEVDIRDLIDGDYLVRVLVPDRADPTPNWADTTFDFRLDDTGPSISFVPPPSIDAVGSQLLRLKLDGDIADANLIETATLRVFVDGNDALGTGADGECDPSLDYALDPLKAEISENGVDLGSGANSIRFSQDIGIHAPGVTAAKTIRYCFQIEARDEARHRSGQGGGNDSTSVAATDVTWGPCAPPLPPPPVACAGPDRTLRDTLLTLDGTCSTGTGLSYVWAEGVALIGSGPTPLVRLDIGTHTIVLTVTDRCGQADSDQVVITVEVEPPLCPQPHADAGPDKTVVDSTSDGSEPVLLDGSGSTGRDLTYIWTEGADTLARTATDTVTVPLAWGEHHIALTVTDSCGQSDADQVKITVVGLGSLPPGPRPPAKSPSPDTSTTAARSDDVTSALETESRAVRSRSSTEPVARDRGLLDWVSAGRGLGGDGRTPFPVSRPANDPRWTSGGGGQVALRVLGGGVGQRLGDVPHVVARFVALGGVDPPALAERVGLHQLDHRMKRLALRSRDDGADLVFRRPDDGAQREERDQADERPD